VSRLEAGESPGNAGELVSAPPAGDDQNACMWLPCLREEHRQANEVISVGSHETPAILRRQPKLL
jgi:hypothetical protein